MTATKTKCLITYTLPYADWEKYTDNLIYNPAENVVLSLIVDGRVKVQQQILITKITHKKGGPEFAFEGTYQGEQITGNVKFHPTTKRFVTGEVIIG